MRDRNLIRRRTLQCRRANSKSLLYLCMYLLGTYVEFSDCSFNQYQCKRILLYFNDHCTLLQSLAAYTRKLKTRRGIIIIIVRRYIYIFVHMRRSVVGERKTLYTHTTSLGYMKHSMILSLNNILYKNNLHIKLIFILFQILHFVYIIHTLLNIL